MTSLLICPFLPLLSFSTDTHQCVEGLLPHTQNRTSVSSGGLVSTSTVCLPNLAEQTGEMRAMAPSGIQPCANRFTFICRSGFLYI